MEEAFLTSLGGTLMSPRWDKTVPFYLRPQILTACEKLVRLKLKKEKYSRKIKRRI